MKTLFTLPCFLFLVLLFACEGNTAARKAARGPFFVADPDHLYFKNTRLRNYHADESQQITEYRHAELTASDAALHPVLLDNWLADEATLRFEVRTQRSGKAAPGPFRLDLRKADGWRAHPVSVPPTIPEIKELRRHLATQQELRIVMGLDTLRPYPAASRKLAKEVLDDYLRLVGAN